MPMKEMIDIYRTERNREVILNKCNDLGCGILI
jgi:hypothetical protein